MQKYLGTIIIGVLFPFVISAQNTYIVDLSGEGDFDTIHEAVESASDGDTLLVQSDQFIFNNTNGRIIIDKTLTIIGTGFNTVNDGGTELFDVTGGGFFDLASGSDESRISGFRMINQVTGTSISYPIIIRSGADEIEISQNIISVNTTSGNATLVYTSGENVLIKNNIFFGGEYHIYASGANTHVSNNIFGDRGTTSYYSIYEAAGGLEISNNLFTGIRGSILYFTYSGEAYSNVFISNSSNRIYYLSSATPTIINNGYFDNSDDAASSTDLDVSAVTNDPLFNNLEVDEDDPFDLVFFDSGNFDFSLKESSSYLNAGRSGSDYNNLDGSRNDIGIFGGPYPFTMVMGGSTIPTVSNFIISPTTVSPTGTITIQAQGRVSSGNN